MFSRSLNFLYKLLKTEVSLKRIYFFLLRKMTGLKPVINEHSFDSFQEKVRNLDLKADSVILKKLNPTYVLLRQMNIDCKVDFANTIDHLKIILSGIKEIPSIYTLVKWKYHNLDLSARYRDYFLRLSAKINTVLSQDFSLKTQTKLNMFDPDLIELDRRVRVTEELIGIFPYVRKAKTGVLYKVPVVKKSLYKSYFSNSQIDNFREILAKQAMTRKTNIELIGIYDKFSVDNYSAIKQDPESKGLICYLNSKLTKLSNDSIYYLVIGQRKDTKDIVKALALLN